MFIIKYYYFKNSENTKNKKINSIPTPVENKEPQGDLDIPSFLRKKGNK